MTSTPTPTFELDEDGQHVWWYHHCSGPASWQPVGAMLPLHGSQGWTTVSTDPLTVTPSILCLECGCHGWIRDGKWIAA